MNVWDFMGQHPVLTFFLAYFAAWAVGNLFKRPKCDCKKYGFMKLMEAFLGTEAGKQITPEQRPFVENLLRQLAGANNAAVDACLDLIQKWGEIKQLDTTEDFKLLVEYIRKIKEDFAE